MKKFLKLGISLVYLIIIIKFIRPLINLFNSQKHKQISIFYYHSIPGDKVLSFSRQLDYILKKTTPLSLDHIEICSKNIKYSIITFDDAFRSVIENAVPELTKRNVPFTVFIPSGLLGKKPLWLEGTDDEDKDEVIATLNELLTLPKDLVTFGSHSISHPRLASLNEDQAYEEIKGSKDHLESLLRHEIKYIAFPYGDYNEQTLDLCKKAGYKEVFTINYESNYEQPESFERGRVPVHVNDLMIEFKLKVAGAYNWMNTVRLLKLKVKKKIKS